MKFGRTTYFIDWQFFLTRAYAAWIGVDPTGFIEDAKWRANYGKRHS